jgi:RNA polymerase-binding transcription factor DksA
MYRHTEKGRTLARKWSRAMDALTRGEIERFAQQIAARKAQLMDEVRTALARKGKERYADLLGDTGDAGDISAAVVLRDVSEAEIVRDIGELRDISAAEERVAAGRYGTCTDCGEAIDRARLQAYPTAKRCLACQQHREKTRAPSKFTGR